MIESILFAFSVVALFFLLFCFSFSALFLMIKQLKKKDPYFISKRNDEMIKDLGTVICIILLAFTVTTGLTNFFNDIKDFILLLTITLATMGWLFSNFIASRNSIRQHTITVLTQLRMSTEFMKNANTLQKIFDSEIIINNKYYDKLIDEKAFGETDSIRYILNYLEFVAAGIRLGDLDEQLVRSAQGRMFITSYQKCKLFIVHLNSENKTTFEHLIATYERWK